MTEPLRVGVIGANWGMRAHLPAWHATGDAQVRAVCTSRRETAEQAAREFSVPRPCWDALAMCADPELDIIDIGTRPDLRAPMVLAALENGKHVFASANFAADLQAARQMRDAARRAGTSICALDSVFAWQPAHRRLKQLLEQGEIGRPIAVHARLFISHFTTPDGGGQGWRWFGVRRHGASAMRNLGTHSLHLLTWLLGPVEAVAAQMTIAKRQWEFADGSVQHPEVEDTAQMMLSFANGTMGVLTLGWASPAKTGWYMELTGDRQTAASEDDAGFPCGSRVRLSRGARGGALMPEAPPGDLLEPEGIRFQDPPRVPQAYDIAGAVKAMTRAIGGIGAVFPSFEDAFHVEAVLDAARRAAASRRWVDVESD